MWNSRPNRVKSQQQQQPNAANTLLSIPKPDEALSPVAQALARARSEHSKRLVPTMEIDSHSSLPTIRALFVSTTTKSIQFSSKDGKSKSFSVRDGQVVPWGLEHTLPLERNTNGLYGRNPFGPGVHIKRTHRLTGDMAVPIYKRWRDASGAILELTPLKTEEGISAKTDLVSREKAEFEKLKQENPNGDHVRSDIVTPTQHYLPLAQATDYNVVKPHTVLYYKNKGTISNTIPEMTMVNVAGLGVEAYVRKDQDSDFADEFGRPVGLSFRASDTVPVRELIENGFPLVDRFKTFVDFDGADWPSMLSHMPPSKRVRMPLSVSPFERTLADLEDKTHVTLVSTTYSRILKDQARMTNEDEASTWFWEDNRNKDGKVIAPIYPFSANVTQMVKNAESGEFETGSSVMARSLIFGVRAKSIVAHTTAWINANTKCPIPMLGLFALKDKEKRMGGGGGGGDDSMDDMSDDVTATAAAAANAGDVAVLEVRPALFALDNKEWIRANGVPVTREFVEATCFGGNTVMDKKHMVCDLGKDNRSIVNGKDIKYESAPVKNLVNVEQGKLDLCNLSEFEGDATPYLDPNNKWQFAVVLAPHYETDMSAGERQQLLEEIGAVEKATTPEDGAKLLTAFLQAHPDLLKKGFFTTRPGQVQLMLFALKSIEDIFPPEVCKEPYYVRYAKEMKEAHVVRVPAPDSSAATLKRAREEEEEEEKEEQKKVDDEEEEEKDHKDTMDLEEEEKEEEEKKIKPPPAKKSRKNK